MVVPLMMHPDEEALLEGIEDEADDYVEPKWRKPLLFILAVFMLFLVLGYYLVYSDALIGIINSETVHDAVLTSDGISIVFQNSSLERLQEEYIAHQGREIKACLFGSVIGKEYRVTGITFPEVISASVVHIQTPGCHQDAIIDLHSHPINRCVPSQQDLQNFNRNKAINAELVMLIMCSKNRFSVEQ